MSTKPTNPKDAIGIRKIAIHHVPQHILQKVSLAMLEGAIKYGSYNYRVAGVRSSIYYDAFMRHVMAWWEGQDIDPESGLPHLWKAMACILVLEDAQANDLLNDDRPPKLKDQDWMKKLNEKAAKLIDSLPPAVEPFTEKTYRDTKLFADANGYEWAKVTQVYNDKIVHPDGTYEVRTPSGKKEIDYSWQKLGKKIADRHDDEIIEAYTKAK